MEERIELSQISEELKRRFSIRRCLGQGGFGVVYEAFDRSLGTDVALKALLSMDPAALYAFKQEFRALADVVHDNLVGLHELFFTGGRFYLTMELVRGANFLRYVRPRGGEDATDPSITLSPPATAQRTMAAEIATMAMTMTVMAASEAAPTSADTLLQSVAEVPRVPAKLTEIEGDLDVERLRRSLSGLAEGVAAIHRTGRVHRDLKPSNVLVTDAGQSKILDFGLVGSFESLARDRVLVVGTPAYMSPEQATGASAGASSDWYSVGVMLYEALTGSVPHLFAGTRIDEMLYAKHLVDPPDPRELWKDAPADLAELAMRLLDRDPAARAGADDVLHVSRGAARPSAPPVAPEPAAPRASFVGRARELGAMRDALEACARTNQCVALVVHGTSGMGKSDLVRHFLDGVAEENRAIVLEGRCHEREWVPYKALDGAVDTLARWLGDVDPEDRAALVPPGFSSLARIFPVLGRLSEEGQEQEAPDPHEVRRRAFEALRQLLARLAERRPVVLSLDDLQWADADSAALLDALLAAPAPPRLLLVASYRTEEASGSPVCAMLPRPSASRPGIDAREVVVGPLSLEDAEALALSILGEEGDAEARRKASRVAREAAGSPFFVGELARFVASGRSMEGLDLGGVVSARVSALPEAARMVVEIISTAGRPIEPVIVKEAAGIDDEASARALAILRGQGLVRSKGGRDEARVETYHDKIRETVVRGLDEEVLRLRHAALGGAMESMSNADPEALAMHFRMAGDPSRARAYMERAAKRAERALAFDRAATLYRMALELADPSEVGALELRLGDALAKAGRGAEAASVFLAATGKVGEAEARVARQRAVEHLLRAGHVDEGLVAARELLEGAGLRVPKSPRRALLNVVVSRVKQRFRGYEFVERNESEIDPAVLHRIDLCWSLGNGLGGFDVIRGADFQARHLALSLDAGEPYRIARAFAWEGILHSINGSADNLVSARELALRADAIATRIGHPHAIAWASAANTIVTQNEQRFREAAILCGRTIERFREACSDIAWELGSMHVWWLFPALWQLGEFGPLMESLSRVESDAAALGDRYMQTSLAVCIRPLCLCVEDRPRDALALSEKAIAGWTTVGYHTIHWYSLFARVSAVLYLGDTRRAHAMMAAERGALESSMLIRSSIVVRVRAYDLRARIALAMAKETRSPERFLREAEHMAELLEVDRTPWTDGSAFAIRGALFARRGEVDRAIAAYARARSAYLMGDMDMPACAVSYRMGQLEGGAAGRERVAAAEAYFRARGVVKPDRFVGSMLAE